MTGVKLGMSGHQLILLLYYSYIPHRSSSSTNYYSLLSPTGHSGPVRSLYIQDSEHFFLSASKDKTVKLWSLSNHGDGTAQSASSWTYYRHARGVFSVDMVESLRQAVSCDGSVHVSIIIIVIIIIINRHYHRHRHHNHHHHNHHHHNHHRYNHHNH